METQEIQQIKLIVENSRLALSNNLVSFDTNNTKAGVFISISAFSIPLFLNIFSAGHISFIWTFYLFIPIFVSLIGLYFFICALKTKKVDNGLSHNKYDSLVNKPLKEILLFEMGCNKDSINKNLLILEKQESQIKYGLNLTLIGLSSFTLLYLINLTTINFS